jgi:Protein of unknown function (DUF3153)
MRFSAVNSVFGDMARAIGRGWRSARWSKPFGQQATTDRWSSVLLLLVLSLGLTGCLDAQTQIRFDSPQHGQIVQNIQLGSQLAAAQGWLNQLETQARQLGGQVQRPDRQTLSIALPFTNAQDLETKFNQLVTPPAGASDDLPPIAAHLQVTTSNLLLLQRDRLVYDIDLTALGLQAPDGSVLFDASQGLDLSFGVAGPWGAGGRAGQKANGITRWNLQPGQTQRIVATLWMPSPIGLGAAAIAGLVAAGTYYQRQRT